MVSWELKGKKIQIITLVVKDGFCTLIISIHAIFVQLYLKVQYMYTYCMYVLPFSLYSNIGAPREKSLDSKFHSLCLYCCLALLPQT